MHFYCCTMCPPRRCIGVQYLRYGQSSHKGLPRVDRHFKTFFGFEILVLSNSNIRYTILAKPKFDIKFVMSFSCQKCQNLKNKRHLRIGSCLACVYRVMDTLGKFGERERSVRVARGAAESSSSFLSALQTSQVYP